MSLADKARTMAEQWKGRAKEKIGGAMKDENIRAEGAADRAEAKARQSGGQARDAGQEARDTSRG